MEITESPYVPFMEGVPNFLGRTSASLFFL